MGLSNKTVVAALILVMMMSLSFPLIQVPVAYSAEWDAEVEALVLLEDVVNLDIGEYNVTLDVYDVRYPEHLDGLAQENVVYLLESDGSTVQAAFAFVNHTLHHFQLFLVEGLPVYSQTPPEGVLDRADNVLGRFQDYSQNSPRGDKRDFESMSKALGAINQIEPTESKRGNITLKVMLGRGTTAFKWMSTINGVNFPGLTVEFQNRTFCGLGDNWRPYQVGSAQIHIQREEAMDIARDQADDLSWKATTQDGKVEVTNFEIADKPLVAKLITTRSREPLTLYPSWEIELYLDKVYPGGVNRISVALWADTGEVISCIPLSVGGGFLDTVSPSDSHSENSTPSSLDWTLISAVIVIVAMATVATITIHKKTHQ